MGLGNDDLVGPHVHQELSPEDRERGYLDKHLLDALRHLFRPHFDLVDEFGEDGVKGAGALHHSSAGVDDFPLGVDPEFHADIVVVLRPLLGRDQQLVPGGPAGLLHPDLILRGGVPEVQHGDGKAVLVHCGRGNIFERDTW